MRCEQFLLFNLFFYLPWQSIQIKHCWKRGLLSLHIGKYNFVCFCSDFSSMLTITRFCEEVKGFFFFVRNYRSTL